MLFVAIDPLFAVAQHSKISADTYPRADVVMRINTVVSVLASPMICEVNAQWNAFRCRIMRKLTVLGVERTVVS